MDGQFNDLKSLPLNAVKFIAKAKETECKINS
jgi:hypothetical protein